MIDTVQLRHQVLMPSSLEMRERGFLPVPGQANKWRWSYSVAGQTVPRLTWRATESGDWLTAEVSIPKLLYTSNVGSITANDVHEGLKTISRLVSQTTGVNFEASTALVGRVDYYYGFQVGEDNMRPYLSTASLANLPRFHRRIIERSSVTFTNRKKSKVVQLYDKGKEILEQIRQGKMAEAEQRASVGILRLEVRHHTSSACIRLALKHHLPSRTAKDLLSLDIAFRELDEIVADLGFKCPTVAIDRRVDGIRKAFGDTAQCRRLMGFITLLDRYGEDFWQQRCAGYSRSKYYVEAKLLRDAGLWLRSDQPLPALKMH